MLASLTTLIANYNLKFVDEEMTATRYDLGSDPKALFEDCDSVEIFYLIIFTPKGKNLGNITFISEYSETEQQAVFEIQDHSDNKVIAEIVRDLFETEQEF